MVWQRDEGGCRTEGLRPSTTTLHRRSPQRVHTQASAPPSTPDRAHFSEVLHRVSGASLGTLSHRAWALSRKAEGCILW